MTAEVADISSYQHSNVIFMKQLKQYASSLIVKLTEGSASGSAYFNPKAIDQVSNGFEVFDTVGVYHYFRGNSQRYGANDPVNEAKWFYTKIKELGFNTDTVCAIDVEDQCLQDQVTADINLFLGYLWAKGYHKLIVYASGSWFTSGRIIRTQLYQHVPIWVAAYGVNQPGVDNVQAWQYSDNGHGLAVDFSYDFTGELTGTSIPMVS